MAVANIGHVSLVKRGATAIRKWHTANQGVRFDLSDAYLSNAQLRGADLSDADLRGADVSHADLSGADLADADLSGADLSGADLRGAYLNGADLRGSDLSDADLSSANAKGANLSDTNLSGAKLNEANLSGVNLSRANVSGADLSDANLSAADLSGAQLRRAYMNRADLSDAVMKLADLNGASFIRADLSRAQLSGADFQNVVIAYTTFADIDLSEVHHLDSAQHDGPSTIGVDTLYRSNGKIPPVFLRGCGFPDDFITYVPSLVGTAFDFYSCFISYSHSDKSFARRLHDALQGRGIRCWLDEHALLPGDDVYLAIDQGIRVWDKVLLCTSRASLSSWWVEREIETAIEKERTIFQERGAQVLKIIPLDLDGHFFEYKGPHGTTLRKRVAADFQGWENDNTKFEREFERVVQALRSDPAARRPHPKEKL